MRLCFTIILLNFFFLARAQNKENTIKYLWQNEQNNIKALVEIYNVDNKKNAGCIYFLTQVDTSYNITDSIFKIIRDSSLFSSVIKISFYPLADTNKFQLLANEIMVNILPGINKKYSKPFGNNVISGINEYAIIALNISLNFSSTFNKTALLFNNYNPDSVDIKKMDSSFQKLKGKLFMYVAQSLEENNTANYLADIIALKSSAILYKYDSEKSSYLKNIFTEAFNWLMTDGNNYILKTAD